jgi:hypothetical protein
MDGAVSRHGFKLNPNVSAVCPAPDIEPYCALRRQVGGVMRFSGLFCSGEWPISASTNDGSAAGALHRPIPRALTRRQHDDGRALPHPIEEIDDILIGHADAAR